ncbi:MAG TPA: hypothetical protein VK137_14585, partial [Planctomycetaceae bacterium]|nr:hypothetical protein [Planctomycetaceae bacterium]
GARNVTKFLNGDHEPQTGKRRADSHKPRLVRLPRPECLDSSGLRGLADGPVLLSSNMTPL